jgi:uncharacterized membrane protein YqjE
VTVTPDGQAPRHAASHATDQDATMGELVKQVSNSISDIIQGEIKLAKLELRSSVKFGGVGIAMFGAAAVLLVFSLTFGLIALAEGLIAAGLYRWLGYLVVFGALLAIIAVLVFIGVRSVKRVKAPQRTIDTSKDTVAYLKTHTPGSKSAS